MFPCVEQLVNALGDAASMDEATLGWVEDRRASKDAAQPIGKYFHEQFTEATLQTDGSNVVHCTIFLLIFHQWNDHTGLPSGWEKGMSEAAREETLHQGSKGFASMQCQLPEAC